MFATGIFSLAGLFLNSPLVFAQDVSVSVPVEEPSSAELLDPALVSFSIEQDRWTDWAGTDAPNTFFVNTLNNLAERTGTPPSIRIGADSGDHTDFSDNVEFSEAIFPAPSAVIPYPEATNITVGAAYYTLASRLPPGTRVIWGVNLGTDNITAAFLEARAIRDAFNSAEMKAKDVKLMSVEIGNEPDVYGILGHRNLSTWTVQEYVKEWTTFARNVSAAAGINKDGPTFFGLAFSHIALLDTSLGFSFDNAVANGLLDSLQGKLIDEISQHFGAAGITNLPTLMSKTLIRSNVSLLSEDIASVQAKGLDFVLGETNSYPNHGASGVSNAAGAAIWALDYTLLAASIGVKRMHFHEGIGFRYNFIQPATLTRSIIDASPLSSPLPPHIQPAYYGAIVASEAVGNSGMASLVELDIPDDTLSGYAIFEGGEMKRVKRVVVINSEAFLSGVNEAERGWKNVTLSFGDGLGHMSGEIEVKRLVIGHADDTSGITWAGQSFETSSALPSGDLQVEKLPIKNGAVCVGINATEAVLLSFN